MLLSYMQEGMDALIDRSRRPVRYANHLPPPVERLIIATKRDTRIGPPGRPGKSWSGRWLATCAPRHIDGACGSRSVRLMKRARQRRRFTATELSHALQPNGLWCTDFKGEFKTDDGRYSYPDGDRSSFALPPSSTAYDGLPDVEYPFHDRDILVTACGRICMARKKINVSTVLAGQKLGITEVDDGIWLVSFMHYDLGYIDLEQRTLQTIDNPFGTRVSPMS